MITHPKEGMKVKVVANSNGHDYTVGATYAIKRVDHSDNTCRLTDPMGRTLDWCPTADLIACNQLGWDWLRENLPADALELLCAFDGLENLSLKEEVSNTLISGIPDLRQRILDATEAQANSAQTSKDKSPDKADDDDFDLDLDLP